ncbi:MAG: flagellar export chaperone FliS [Actinomycetota bacterium]|nr:flagellar export chaperone FliS [Actinomycetota bacterium]
MRQQLANQYLADKVATATPAQLTGMLYDGAVGALRSAVHMQEGGQWQEAVPRVLKAQRIVLELRESLNHEVSGDLAANLWQLYTWCYACLLRCTGEREVEVTKEALSVLSELADAWKEGVLGVAPVSA